MKTALLAVLLAVMALPVAAQYNLDTTRVEQNRWAPTKEAAYIVYLVNWQEYLRKDTIGLRTGQYFRYVYDKKPFACHLDSVSGYGSKRRSHYHWYYQDVDTTTRGNFDLPYANFGYADQWGRLPYGPSDSTYIGQEQVFIWGKECVRISPHKIENTGPNTLVKLIFTIYQTPDTSMTFP
jgi:hypothetical protein